MLMVLFFLHSYSISELSLFVSKHSWKKKSEGVLSILSVNMDKQET